MATYAADHANLSVSEDWDASSNASTSVPFPRDQSQEQGDDPSGEAHDHAEGKTRTLSHLLRLYAEEGTDVSMSVEEADAVADALGQWVSTLDTSLSTIDELLPLARRSTPALHPTKELGTTLPSAAHPHSTCMGAPEGRATVPHSACTAPHHPTHSWRRSGCLFSSGSGGRSASEQGGQWLRFDIIFHAPHDFTTIHDHSRLDTHL
jgi:hypothetical protein